MGMMVTLRRAKYGSQPVLLSKTLFQTSKMYDSFKIENSFFCSYFVLFESESRVSQLDFGIPHVAEDDFELLVLLSSRITDGLCYTHFVWS